MLRKLLKSKSAYFLTAMVLSTGSLSAQRPQQPAPMVGIAKAEVVEERAVRNYVGNIAASEEVQLPARVAGILTSQNFVEGGMVKKGDLLMTIEDTTYKAEVDQAKATLDQIEAELKFATSNYKRQKGLADKDTISVATLEEATRLIAFTKGRYDAAKATLAQAENEYSYTKIYAPIDGRIGKIRYTYGNFVNSTSEPLANIVKVDPIYIKYYISERDFLNLFKTNEEMKETASMSITMANGKQFKGKGKILLVDNKVDERTGTIAIWATFENPDMMLIPGGYVTVSLSEKSVDKQVGVPLSAILTDRAGSYVYVLDADNIATRRDVIIAEVVGDKQIIKSGLTAGENVISSGSHKVVPGTKVEIRKK
ncbi:MAG: efflux RND transporter periplasmic adaptor subunit [Victivallaceae bacterium]|nr:efflux RND transporter periplasmic adaptor subunit [Victivallaceae bacterium]MDD4180381.1 efflux RND transporter periplasmic adaptor subunit [Victivallaceae bacterium]